MTAPLRAHLDEIEAALRAAGPEYPRPWRQDSGWGENVLAADGDTVAGADYPFLAALIVAAVNALPGLLAAVREQADAIDKVRGLHRPWYEINGVRHEHTVTAPCYEDDCACDGEGHEVPACSECRWSDGDVDGYLLWPCPTARLLSPAPDHGQPTGEEER